MIKMNSQNSQLIAVALILLAVMGIVLVPLFIINPDIFQVWNQYAFFIILFVGFLFIIFLSILIALKQRRNIWG
jgi:hypothetical protein